MNDDVTRTSANTDETRMSPVSNVVASQSGWLSSSGSVDHGRFAPGTLLDNRYRVLGLLGRGGMGEVYRADDLRLGQQVALKFLPEALAVDARRLAQFHNEVRTARQVSHPNVCRVYDIGEINGQLFLTMEYVDGEDLSLLLRRIGRLPEERAVEIARQICAGLAAAHERGILHRDLKPANIMLDGAGKVRIMDFSLAAVGQVDDVRAGTPAYMAPEQLAGREVTVRSDVYALGLVLYEVFTGRRAFEARTIADLVEQHQSGTITAPGQLVTSLDPVVDRAIMRCLDADPQRRPVSALAVAASLPGGDPLAAALAAGETPSPEMVAAAGGQGATLTLAQGGFWLALIAVLLFATLRIADRSNVLSTVPLDKSADVLADRANEFRIMFGYTDAVERIGRFAPSGDVNTWASKNLTSAQRQEARATGRPSALVYWHRTSRGILVPRSPLSSVGITDPPLTTSGMTLTIVDTRGRLLRFEAVPPQKEAEGGAPSAPVSWDVMFTAAGLDRAAFADVPPSRTPQAYADERHAWTGVLPGTTIPVRIEAAGYRGRAVLFELVGPWTTAPRDSAAPPSAGGGNPILISALLIGAVFAARANLKSGRADRRGALRLAAFEFAIMLGAWLASPHVSDAANEQQRFFTVTGISLFLGGTVCLIYLGLEPFVRRSSPLVLVGWSRVLSGRLRDSLVGRDLLIGVALGVVAAYLNFVPFDLPHRFGWSEAQPFLVLTGALDGIRLFLADLFQGLNSGLQSALIGVFSWVTARVVVEWAWHRTVRRVWHSAPTPSGTAIAVAAALILALLSYRSGPTGHAWADGTLEFASTLLILLVILHAGLLATIVGFLVSYFLNNMPVTLDSNRLYSSASHLLVLSIIAAAILGFWLARGDAAPSRSRGPSPFGGQ